MKKEINIMNDCRGMFDEEIIDTIFQSRGIKNKDEFLNPSEKWLLPLDSLYRIDEASKLFIDGMVNGKKFMTLADP